MAAFVDRFHRQKEEWAAILTSTGTRTIKFDGETSWAECVLSDLTALFGRWLDEVPGLGLELYYGCDDDGRAMTARLVDGYGEGSYWHVFEVQCTCMHDVQLRTGAWVY